MSCKQFIETIKFKMLFVKSFTRIFLDNPFAHYKVYIMKTVTIFLNIQYIYIYISKSMLQIGNSQAIFPSLVWTPSKCDCHVWLSDIDKTPFFVGLYLKPRNNKCPPACVLLFIFLGGAFNASHYGEHLKNQSFVVNKAALHLHLL